MLDPAPPARLVRRRLDGERLAALAEAHEPAARFGALLAAHGVLARDRAEAIAAVLGAPVDVLASDAGAAIIAGRFAARSVAAAGEAAAIATVADLQAVDPLAPGVPLAGPRLAAAKAMRRAAPGASVTAGDGAAVVEGLVARGALIRDGDFVREPGQVPARPAPLQAAMDRLVAVLDAPAPPSLADAARSVGCPPEGVRALEAEARIVRLEADLAYAAPTLSRLEALAVAMARGGDAHASRIPGRDRDEPPVRTGDPRGARRSRHPAPRA